ncbi:MAG: F0F1 ATP synthase subunit B [Porphyromonadaceae bacterium]|nr:F0F1 ATP synthase subunit B [Porphyromonadaceae bacterium]
MELFTPEVGLIIWLIIPFLVVFYILAKAVWPSILKGVEARNNFIDESLLAAKQAKDDLARVKSDSEKLIDQARKEQAAILDEAMKSRDKIIDSAKEKADVEASKLIETVRNQILLEKEDALRQIRREVALLSVDIAEKVLRENLDKKNEQMDMIDRLLDEVNIPKS